MADKSYTELLDENAREREAFHKRTGIDPKTGKRYIDPATGAPYTAAITQEDLLEDQRLARRKASIEAGAKTLQADNEKIVRASLQHATTRLSDLKNGFKSWIQGMHQGLSQAVSTRPVGGAIATVAVAPILEVFNLAARVGFWRMRINIDRRHGIAAPYSRGAVRPHLSIAQGVARHDLGKPTGPLGDYTI